MDFLQNYWFHPNFDAGEFILSDRALDEEGLFYRFSGEQTARMAVKSLHYFSDTRYEIEISTWL